MPVLILKLLEAETADGNGDGVIYPGRGLSTLHIYGTFDGCTIAIEGSTDGGTTWTAFVTSYTAAVITNFEEGRILVRAVVSSAGASTSISCDIAQQAV